MTMNDYHVSRNELIQIKLSLKKYQLKTSNLFFRLQCKILAITVLTTVLPTVIATDIDTDIAMDIAMDIARDIATDRITDTARYIAMHGYSHG